MKIAFYAPMKAPTHPIPSGDREIARALIKGLECSGHEVEVVSKFRSWEGDGDVQAQQRIALGGEQERATCLQQLQSRHAAARPQAWLSYHVYHKSPDYLGADISGALDIPYLIAEASYAAKQAAGNWQAGHQHAQHCIQKANTLIALNSSDIEGLRSALQNTSSTRIVRMKPFLVTPPPVISDEERTRRRAILAERYKLKAAHPWLITVAMMRSGDKLSSYKLLARGLLASRDLNWQLLVVGDGKARTEVEEYYATTLGAGRVAFLGQLEQNAVMQTMSTADLFVWPAVREALGMAMLEAQFCGLPVVAEKGGGVADVVQHNETGLLSVSDQKQNGFARDVRYLLENPGEWKRMGCRAQRHMRSHHSLGSAAWILNDCLTRSTE